MTIDEMRVEVFIHDFCQYSDNPEELEKNIRTIGVKCIPEFEGYFMFGNGQVWSTKSNKWLTLSYDGGLYFYHFSKYGIQSSREIRRLYKKVFGRDMNEGMEKSIQERQIQS